MHSAVHSTQCTVSLPLLLQTLLVVSVKILVALDILQQQQVAEQQRDVHRIQPGRQPTYHLQEGERGGGG